MYTKIDILDSINKLSQISLQEVKSLQYDKTFYLCKIIVCELILFFFVLAHQVGPKITAIK